MAVIGCIYTYYHFIYNIEYTHLSTTTIGPFWYSKCHICTISNSLISDDNSRTEYLLCINLTGSIKSSCTDWIRRSLVS